MFRKYTTIVKLSVTCLKANIRVNSACCGAAETGCHPWGISKGSLRSTKLLVVFASSREATSRSLLSINRMTTISAISATLLLVSEGKSPNPHTSNQLSVLCTKQRSSKIAPSVVLSLTRGQEQPFRLSLKWSSSTCLHQFCLNLVIQRSCWKGVQCTNCNCVQIDYLSLSPHCRQQVMVENRSGLQDSSQGERDPKFIV